MLIAFEGLDQSGKETQARRLAESLAAEGRRVETLSFPDYETPIGREIGAALAGEREFPPDVMQLLYIANRYEWRPKIEQWLREGAVVVCDRYVASSIAYGESHGLDAAWLDAAQQYLPRADLTLCSTSRPKPRLRASARGVTSTNATWRCSHACAQAIDVRPPSLAGQSWMASSRKTRSRPKSPASCRSVCGAAGELNPWAELQFGRSLFNPTRPN